MITRRQFTKATLVSLAGALVLPAPAIARPRVVAFPGAQGFGARSVGGRGGRVISVTNLDDSGPGSLRSALEARGPRTIVFDRGGTISLDRPLEINEPFVTIAGQTAPGGGICIRNGRSDHCCVFVQTHDVVMRFLRIRAGIGSATFPNENIRAITVTDDGASHVPYNVIIDHCSLSWGVDTVITVGGSSHDETVQWCIISEGLNNSVHPEGPHSRGLNLRDQSERITVHHNLFAHNDYRNPQVSNVGSDQVVNNVIYDFVNKSMSSSDIMDVEVSVEFIGNYTERGPDSTDPYEIELHPETGAGWAVYADGNIGPHRTSNTEPESDALGPRDRPYLVARPPFRAPRVRTSSAKRALHDVLAHAGATIPSRDAVDRRIIGDVKSGTGHLIDDPSDVGGWPRLTSGHAPRDRDGDGMPDTWERRHHLRPYDAHDGSRLAPDGYTWLEHYLNGLVRHA